MYSIMIKIDSAFTWGDFNVSINLAPLPKKTIHLLPMSELITPISVCSNMAVANNSTSVPHVEVLFIFDFTT